MNRDSSQASPAAARRPLPCLLAAAAALPLAFSAPALAQQTPSAGAAPVSPSAAAGMTTGFSGGMTDRDIEMMQVRAAAQAAEGEAFAASMARSAERSLEEQSRQRTLQTAREEKAIKRSMAERMKWERASTDVQKVSAHDMSTWRTDGGSVRVERNVPDPFLTSLIEEERQLAAREAAASSDRGSGPVAATRRALSWRPFSGGRGSSEELAMAASAFPVEALEGRSVTALVAGGSRPPAPTGEPDAAVAEPQFASGDGARRPSPTPAAMTAPAPAQSESVGSGRIPRISGAQLVDGRPAVSQGGEAPTASAPPQSAPSQSRGTQARGGSGDVLSQPASVSAGLPGAEAESEGGSFFSRLRTGGSSGGLFGIGRRSSPEPAPVAGIDARLFPSDAPAASPNARIPQGGGQAPAPVQVGEFASSAPSTLDLPSSQPEPEQRRGLSIPRPSLSMPSVPSLVRAGGGGGGSAPGVPTSTTINSAGNDSYVVTSTAQFMVYGDDPLQSEVRALSAGTVVRMVKPGDQWASVRLPGGEEGVVQNRNLRPASASEAGGF